MQTKYYSDDECIIKKMHVPESGSYNRETRSVCGRNKETISLVVRLMNKERRSKGGNRERVRQDRRW